jgi:hypothetical protein
VGHFDPLGIPIIDRETECPQSLSILSSENGFFLFRLDEHGECIADTWHNSVEEAQRQAEFEFEIDQTGWTTMDQKS